MSRSTPGAPVLVPQAPVSTPRNVKRLVPGGTAKITIVQANRTAVQYEFYIPASVYRHTAVRKFINGIGGLAPGATIFKGVTGTWKSQEEDIRDEEDINIYRLILSGEFDPVAVRAALHSQIADMMADLAAWHESRQEAFLFTEAVIHADLSTLRKQSARGRRSKASALTGIRRAR